MGEAKANDSSANVITFGSVPLGGFGFGDFINIEQVSGDSWTQQTGADGETVFTKAPSDPVLQITISLMESSASNQYLSAFHELSAKTKNGKFAAFFYKDGSGATIVSAPKACISKPPAIVKGKEAKERVWVFLAKQKLRNDGGM